MNANRITEYRRIISVFSESQRKVLPVVNTCLDNITAASEAMDPVKVSLGGVRRIGGNLDNIPYFLSE